MPYKDKERQKQAQHESYLRNKTEVAKNSYLRRVQRFQWLDKQKQKPCADCGQEFPPYVMDFHHRDKTLKIYSITIAIQRMSRQNLIDEIAKCDLLCANCHRIREHGQHVRYQV